ncbi:MAG: FcoT family thioesterase [Chitinophagaceae bacterium]
METLTNALPQINHSGTRIWMPLMISDAFLAKILVPYRDHAKYLKSAQILDYYEPDSTGLESGDSKSLVTIEGNFSIAESCYIDDTGHFNAVEFNICYNQLAYVLFVKCIQAGIFHRVIPDWAERVNLSFENFIKYQLSSMFIAKIEGSFLKPLNGKSFKARLTITRIMWTDQTAFVYTQISFSDSFGIKSKGPVLLAFRTSNGL